MAFSRLIESIEQGSGKFDLNRTYLIKNTTQEDIEVKWGAMEPDARGAGTYLIKAGEMGGPYPQFLAYHIVKALVSREMQRDGKAKFFGSAEMRAPYEDKYLQEVVDGAEDPFTAKIREQEREKILSEMKSEPIVDSVGTTSSETRRKELKKKSHTDEEFSGANRE